MNSLKKMGIPKFLMGSIYITPGAIEALRSAYEAAEFYLLRHQVGDWGELCDEDKWLNNEALETGRRLLSAYDLSTGSRIWIITEANREITTILTPEEY